MFIALSIGYKIYRIKSNTSTSYMIGSAHNNDYKTINKKLLKQLKCDQLIMEGISLPISPIAQQYKKIILMKQALNNYNFFNWFYFIHLMIHLLKIEKFYFIEISIKQNNGTIYN